MLLVYPVVLTMPPACTLLISACFLSFPSKRIVFTIDSAYANCPAVMVWVLLASRLPAHLGASDCTPRLAFVSWSTANLLGSATPALPLPPVQKRVHSTVVQYKAAHTDLQIPLQIQTTKPLQAPSLMRVLSVLISAQRPTSAHEILGPRRGT